jgi:hypothetical protein
MFQDSILDVHGRYNWRFTEGQQGIKNIIKSGNKKLTDYNFPIDDHYDIYESSDNNNNVGNFEKNLINYYKNTFVELICETTFTEKSFLITEKTQHSVFGCNFPIWISSPGTVAFLRNMGLDVFDDIVDHSYDTIENPIDRLYTAISNNKDILSNPNIKDIWKKNQSRFEKNVDFIKKEMYEFYATRAGKQIDQLHEYFT